MAERYDAKTQTGWKFEKGRSFYYLKGRKLSTAEVLRRGIGDTVKEFFTPITSGAATLRDKLRIDPRSETGESVFNYNQRTAKEKLALQKTLDKNPNVIANQADASKLSPSQYFGTGNFGDKDAQAANIRNIDNMQISAAYRAKVEADPWNPANFPGEVARSNAGDGYTTNMPDLNKPSTITNKEKAEDINKTLSIANNQSAFKSDVFTIDPATGKAVGVMSRNKRRKFEERLKIHNNTAGAG